MEQTEAFGVASDVLWNIVGALTKVDATTVLITTQLEVLLGAIHVVLVNLDVMRDNHLLDLRSMFIFII